MITIPCAAGLPEIHCYLPSVGEIVITPVPADNTEQERQKRNEAPAAS